MSNPLLEAAHEYLRLGYHPVPCIPREKHPIVAWKTFQTTKPTPEQLDAWWAQTPNANIALVLGRGRFAVDLDGGDDAEALLAEAGIALPPDAPRTRTGSGYHVFMASPSPTPDRIALLATDGGRPQVDVRGIGIVIAPPSIHPNGKTYQWVTPLVEAPPAAPKELLDLIHRAPTPKSAAYRDDAAGGNRFWVVDALRGVGLGQRDATCTRLAGYFLKKGIDEDTVISLLTTVYAPACRPEFPFSDVEKCVRSIARRESVADTAARGIAPRHISEVLQEFSTALANGPAPTLPTPFPTLNSYLSGGFGPGELIFLGARPGTGKTALGLEFARHAAQQRQGAVLVVSREMTNLALARRLVAQDARIRATSLKRASLTAQDQWNLKRSLERLTTLPLFFTDDAVSLDEIIGIVAEMANQAPLALLIVDYLQLVRAPKEIKERRHQVEAVSHAMKTLALQYRVPVVCLSSLSRPAHEDKNKPPTLASLRESGELEHDADIILLLHRDYKEEETECIVAKNRDGRLGTADLLFRAEFVAFDEATAAHRVA